MGKLEANKLDALAPGKKHHDGEGLYLDKKTRGASWLFKYTLNGQAREMGLGRYPDVSLAKARDLAGKVRSQKAEGVDPIAARAAVRRQGVTFEAAAREYWNAHCQTLARPHNWLSGMAKNVFPHIGKKPVANLTPDDLIKFLKPMWSQEKTRKLRQWINAVVGYVSVDDPRVDRDLIKKVDNRLGPQGLVTVNHPAVPWQEIPNLWGKLPPTLVGLSMKLLILTGVRVNCVVLADWSEFDFAEKVWTIPAGRVKHWRYRYRVPLTRSMVDLLRDASRKWVSDGLVFSSPDSESGHLSNNAHRLWLHEHKFKDPDGRLASAHGLRSALRTWMGDVKPPVEWRLSEHILQHMGSLGTPTEQAYLRSDQLEQRREVLDRWDAYVVSEQRALSLRRRKVAGQQALLDEIEDAHGRTLREVEKWARETPDEAVERVGPKPGEEA